MKTNYPSDQSQLEFQQLLQEQGITDFDSKGTGGSTWLSVLTHSRFPSSSGSGSSS